MPEEWTLRDASEKKRKADENHGCGPGRPRRAEENNNQRLVEGEEGGGGGGEDVEEVGGEEGQESQQESSPSSSEKVMGSKTHHIYIECHRNLTPLSFCHRGDFCLF